MSKELDPEADGAGEESSTEGTDGGRTPGGPLSLQLPAEPLVMGEARRLVADRNIRIEDLSVCVSQDPVIVIEFLRAANAMFYSAGRSPIASAKTAIMRLGNDVVLDTLDKIRERPSLEGDDVNHWLEIHRSRCRRASIVSTILAETVARTLAEDCQMAALLLFVGDMLAVAHLREQYVKLAEEVSRGSLSYRLVQDYRFDVERMGVNFLRRNGIPEIILFVLDRDARPRSADRAVMRPICLAAGELVDAFDAGRLDRFAPGKSIPPKSSLRTLQFTEPQYTKVFERISEFLYSFRLIEERKKQQAAGLLAADESAPEPAPEPPPRDTSLDNEIQGILNANQASAREAVDAAAAVKVPEAEETAIEQVGLSLETQNQFSLKKPGEKTRTVARVQKRALVAPPKMHSRKGTEFLSTIDSMFEGAENSEAVLTRILDMLVKNGPFEKSALIVVSKDRKTAIVVAARGPSIGNGQKIEINDPLSPLSQCFSKVQSFGTYRNKVSPFGSKSFAVAPIDADHDTPVALYADCGKNGSLTFEARRIFRNVVDILNKKLPSLPGGIPVELQS